MITLRVDNHLVRVQTNNIVDNDRLTYNRITKYSENGVKE